MKKVFFLYMFVIFTPCINLIADTGAMIDTVYSFSPGSGQSVGQDSMYFPKNIFGPPSATAREDVPETSPSEILSLGKGGEIVVGFKNGILRDIPGADFTVFENVIKDNVSGKYFAEPGIISVSPDGINFYTFPFNTHTLDGFAGKTPTYGDKNPFNPAESGGDSFDIADLGLNFIKFIKIKDTALVIAGLPDSSKYINNTAVISGFDLDAVAGLNVEMDSEENVSQESVEKSYLDLPGFIIFNNNFQVKNLKITDCLGKSSDLNYNNQLNYIDKSAFHSGLYIVSYELNGANHVFKSIF